MTLSSIMTYKIMNLILSRLLNRLNIISYITRPHSLTDWLTNWPILILCTSWYHRPLNHTLKLNPLISRWQQLKMAAVFLLCTWSIFCSLVSKVLQIMGLTKKSLVRSNISHNLGTVNRGYLDLIIHIFC